MKKLKLIRVALAVGILAAFSNVIAEKNIAEYSPNVISNKNASELRQEYTQTQVKF